MCAALFTDTIRRRLWSLLEATSACAVFQLFAKYLRYGISAATKTLTRFVHQPTGYVYKPLDTAHSIRIFELVPSQEPSAPVRCRIKHIDLGLATAPYTAISYAWGRRDVPQALIKCDGRQVTHVPPTLYTALKQLRSLSKAGQMFWADALCIDQSGTIDADIEKAQQVQMMDRIFAQAEEVVMYLGDLHSDESDVLHILDKYQGVSNDIWSTISESPNLVEKFAYIAGLDLPPASSTFWAGLARFACRSIFTRVWCIQEFVLAQRVRLMLGQDFREQALLRSGIIRAYQHLTWHYTYNRTYQSTQNLLPHLVSNLWDIADSASAIIHMIELKERVGNSGTFCEQLSASTALFKATDPRDKAYALLGLASDSGVKEDLVVDYREALPDLGLRVSMYLAHTGCARYALYNCVGDQEGQISWAFDLENAARDDFAQLIHGSGETHPRVFQACGQGLRFKSWTSEIRPKGRLVGGYVVDTIDSLMDTHLITRGELKGSAQLHEQAVWLSKVYAWILSVASKQPLPEEQFLDQCWRTMIADLIRGTRPGAAAGPRSRPDARLGLDASNAAWRPSVGLDGSKSPPQATQTAS